MAKLTGKEMAAFAQTKLGTPYVYGAKGSYGKFTQGQLDSLIKAYPKMFTLSYRAKAKKFVGSVCTDCSGLISWYTGHGMGSAQMYSSASKKGLIEDLEKAPIGAVLWHTGHVGVYIGNGYCIEAKGINYGTVKSKVSNTKFTHWLLFNYIEYDEIKAPVALSAKKINPYREPRDIVELGTKGEDAKWAQFELQEAGFHYVAIDGIIGKKSVKAIKAFQQSSKIGVDGEIGPETRKALRSDK